ncbi:MAG TPA: hypothetical protein VEF53_18820 [Patescibacteria group bacterium]|nr:hypothetical protein [Patescibacteria group bacterium]
MIDQKLKERECPFCGKHNVSEVEPPQGTKSFVLPTVNANLQQSNGTQVLLIDTYHCSDCKMIFMKSKSN